MTDNATLTTSASGVDTSDLVAHEKNKKGELAEPRNSDSANEWYYKKQEAELNHRYALDMLKTEYELNNPSRVAELYRQAGINPRAAFGEGSAHGAGLAQSTTPGSASGNYSKSDVTQGFERAQSTLGMIQSVLSDGVQIADTIGSLKHMTSQTKQSNVRTQGFQIENQYKEQQILADLELKKQELLKKGAETDTERKQLEYLNQQIEESKQRIEESNKRIEETNQNIAQSKSATYRIDEEARKLRNENVFFETFGFRPGDPVPSSFVSSFSKLPEHAKSTFNQIKDAIRSAPDPVKSAFERYVRRFPHIKGSVNDWFNRFKSTIKGTPFYKNWQKNKKYW